MTTTTPPQTRREECARGITAGIESGESPEKKVKMAGVTDKMTVVSAPGKVMVAGGYVVLERPNAALVAAVSARVYCVVTSSKRTSPGTPEIKVEVRSPQLEENRSYSVTANGAESVAIERAEEMARNPYIETTIANTFAIVAHVHGPDAELLDTVIVVRGDNAFYNVSDTPDGAEVPRFAKISRSTGAGKHAADVPKTGLGSSAALVTSLTASLLAHYGVVALPAADGVAGTAGSAPDRRAAAFEGEEVDARRWSAPQYLATGLRGCKADSCPPPRRPVSPPTFRAASARRGAAERARQARRRAHRRTHRSMFHPFLQGAAR